MKMHDMAKYLRPLTLEQKWKWFVNTSNVYLSTFANDSYSFKKYAKILYIAYIFNFSFEVFFAPNMLKSLT